MRLRQAIGFLIVAGCAGNSPIDAESVGLTQGPDLAVVEVTVPARVKPGGSLAVSIKVKNTGSTTWTSPMVLSYVGEAGFTSGTLVLPAQTKPNQTATFKGTLGASKQIGNYTLAWRASVGTTAFGPVISAKTEITCSDGLFCNGDERWVNGKCIAGPKPCEDGFSCSADTCDEATDRCARELAAGCAECAAKNCNPNCHGAKCGDDGCGGSCGACVSGEVCAAGVCVVASAAGTCSNALPLVGTDATVPIVAGKYETPGDNSDGYDEVIPKCDTVPAPEKVYKFVLTQTMGFDAQSYGIDTVLTLFKDGCNLTHLACNDDSAPPGDYGSHVYKMLDAGTYFLVVNGFDTHATGPFTVTTRFVPNCLPQCDGKFCGDDGCGFQCGDCEEGEVCNQQTSRCGPKDCVAQCQGRQCGSDGCEGFCGQDQENGNCPEGKACDLLTGACKNAPECDHEKPVCASPCASQEYCGSDCTCHRSRDGRPDLVVDVDALAADPFIDVVNISPASCTVVENCVRGTGDRKLLHFTVGALNQGSADLVVPPPKVRPDLFQYSSCHGHYHFHGFANYALYNSAGTKVLDGQKLAYCMEDTATVLPGPTVGCDKKYDCTTQGIQAGWSDIYGNTLDCQWLDITDIPAGNYRLEVSLNPGRAFEEATFENNSSSIPIVIE